MIVQIPRSTWPLFWCLPPEAQEGLLKFYQDNFGSALEIPSLSGDSQIESLEEINAIKKVGARYGRLPRHLR